MLHLELVGQVGIVLPSLDATLLLEVVESEEHMVPALLDLFAPLGVVDQGIVHLSKLSQSDGVHDVVCSHLVLAVLSVPPIELQISIKGLS